jgi:ribosomal protein L37AE/L43A
MSDYRAICPRCHQATGRMLGTTNEWVWYCEPCDIRFNAADEIRPDDAAKLVRE